MYLKFKKFMVWSNNSAQKAENRAILLRSWQSADRKLLQKASSRWRDQFGMFSEGRQVTIKANLMCRRALLSRAGSYLNFWFLRCHLCWP